MSTILYVDTFGIVLLSEATYLMKGDIFEQVYGMGLPPFKDVLPKLIDHGVPIYV